MMISQERKNFLPLMGKGKKCFKCVRSDEDWSALKHFQDLFEKNLVTEPVKPSPLLIPKILHFIWLGPKSYPEKSKNYLQTWTNRHPGWAIKFWSDHPQGWLPPGIQLQQVDSRILGEFASLYHEGDNFGEKSDLLRLLILQKEGGLYIDHDVECRAPFATLHTYYNFYTGLQNVGNHVLKSAAVLRNSIIGASKNHPILDLALEKTKKNWHLAREKFPGEDLLSLMSRVTHRAFLAFHEAVTESTRDPNFKGMVFPAGYFNEIGGEFGLLAHEDMAGAWYREEMNYYETYLHKRVHKLMKRLHLFTAIGGALILINLGLIFLLWRVFLAA